MYQGNSGSAGKIKVRGSSKATQRKERVRASVAEGAVINDEICNPLSRI